MKGVLNLTQLLALGAMMPDGTIITGPKPRMPLNRRGKDECRKAKKRQRQARRRG